MRTVAIIGSGNMGKAIGTRMLIGGNNVIFVSKAQEDGDQAAEMIQDVAINGATVTAVTNADEAIEKGDVVILATHYASNLELAKNLTEKLAGKIVVDISNALNSTFDGVSTEPGTSAAENIQKEIPQAKVIKAFNTAFAATVLNGEVDGQQMDIYVAGDDQAAKDVVIELINQGKLRGLDVGKLNKARTLEGMAVIIINSRRFLGESAWKIIS